MTVDEFEERKFTAQQIIDELKKEPEKYRWALVDTQLEHNPGFGQNIRWRRGKKTEFRDSLRDPQDSRHKVPRHFAYIKFYAPANYEKKDPKETPKHIFALVAGKTSYSDTYKTDVNFSGDIKKGEPGKAKKWLWDHHEQYLWYLEYILAVWSPEAEQKSDDSALDKDARSVEAHIGSLFGLFKS